MELNQVDQDQGPWGNPGFGDYFPLEEFTVWSGHLDALARSWPQETSHTILSQYTVWSNHCHFMSGKDKAGSFGLETGKKVEGGGNRTKKKTRSQFRK